MLLIIQKFAVIIFIITLVRSQNVNWAFVQAGIVPDMLDYAPRNLAFVEYQSNMIVRLGNEIIPALTQIQPEITWEADPNTYFTIFMTSRYDDASNNVQQFHHWLVVNAKDERGEVVFPYIGPNPAKGTGTHKYVFVIFRQPSKLIFDHKRYDRTERGRTMFTIMDFARKYHFGTPVAGNYFVSQYDYFRTRPKHHLLFT